MKKRDKTLIPYHTFTPLGQVLLVLAVCKANAVTFTVIYPPLDQDRLIRAIAQVETGTTDLSKPYRKVGRAGERSAFQIKPSVWRQYTKEDFKKASTDPLLAEAIARLHITRLKTQIEVTSFGATAWSLALAWNGGLECAIGGVKNRRALDYADRVWNLYKAEQ